MDLNAYQEQAQQTDRVPTREGTDNGVDFVIPLLGLAGETGELLSEYKKHLRDGKSHTLFKSKIEEELGDLLWYVANVATKFELRLDDIAKSNLKKTQDRWGPQDSSAINFDEGYPVHESFPRQFVVELREIEVAGRSKIGMFIDGKQIGAALTDNAEDPDGYRFHDIFHLGYVAVIGWSPVIRNLMGRKRRSNETVDEVQDGGRAQVIDEAVAALVFEYARHHNWLEGVPDLDFPLLRTIKGVTSLLQVKTRSMGEWQQAILLGYEVWRQVLKVNSGRISIDMNKRSMTFVGSADSRTPADPPPV